MFGSIMLTIVLLFLFAGAIGVATFLEVRFGTDGARELVYSARWFEVLLGILILNLIAMLIRGFPYRARSTGYVITHVSFIVILLSAGITRFFGYEGRMSIREGSSSDFIFSNQDHIQLFSGDESNSFPVRLFAMANRTVRQKLDLNGETYRVSVEHYWPHYDVRMQEGPGGVPTVEYAISGPAGMHRNTVSAGDQVEESGMNIRLIRGDLESEEAGEQIASPYGVLEATVDGSVYRLPVPARAGAEMDAGPYRVIITSFYPNFRVGAEPSLNDPMDNPAVRVRLDGPDGAAGERIVFALHPDFDMGHGGGITTSEVKLAYKFGKNLLLTLGEEGMVTARPDFQVDVGSMDDADNARVAPAGEAFTLEPGTMVQSGDLIFVLLNAWQSATLQGGEGDDEDLPPAARIAVENDAGERAETVVQKWSGSEGIQLGDQSLALKFGPVRWKVPYRIHLDDFKLISYPGSDNPASFESHVRVFDDERGVQGEPVRIYMNHPLTYRGHKHFQSSYDTDRKGTVLSVNHDPGKWPTYFGYAMLTVGLLMILTRGWLWHRHGDQRGAKA